MSDQHDPKATLHRYLNVGRDALVWKLDGLSEYDLRRPLTPSGTNLLGLVKHLAIVEMGYFGDCFGRPIAYGPEWVDRNEPNADMWARPDEPTEFVLGRYAAARAHADETIEALDLDSTGTVAWWPTPPNPVTLHLLLVHMATETHRHAGHADIVRELIDGELGHRPAVSNLPDVDADYWPGYHDRVEAAAVEAARRQG